jgi:hypothetical protein
MVHCLLSQQDQIKCAVPSFRSRDEIKDVVALGSIPTSAPSIRVHFQTPSTIPLSNIAVIFQNWWMMRANMCMAPLQVGFDQAGVVFVTLAWCKKDMEC